MLTLLARLLSDVLRLSWQAAILIVAVLVVQWLARGRLPARWRYNLWLLVVLRLLLPFSVQSSLSVFNFARIPVWESDRVSIASAPSRPVAGLATSSVVVPPAAPGPPLPVAVGQPPDTPREAEVAPPPTPKLIFPELVLRQEYDLEEVVVWVFLNVFAYIIVPVWLVGMGVLAIQVGRTTASALRQVRHATRIDHPEVAALFEACRRDVGVRTRVELRETALVKGPALFGVWRPRLLLPPGLARQFALKELRHVFLHELAHVKRRDVAVNWLLTLLQVIHWFNPVIWFGFGRMRADRELACDALAMSCTGEEEARAYGLTIIKLLETFSRSTAVPNLVGILENKSQMARRISLISTFRSHRRLSVLAIGLLALLAITGLTDAVRSTRAEPPQAAAESAKAPVAKPLRLTVLDAQTGQPVPDAAIVAGYGRGVSYPSGPPPLLRTNKDGMVVVPGYSRGSWGFGVIASDFAPKAVQWLELSGSPPPVIPPDYTIKLDRGVTIGGVMRDEAGQPLANVRVVIKGFSDLHGDGVLAARQEFSFYEPTLSPGAVTDAAGHWTCPHFPPSIEVLELDCTRADGAFARFHTAYVAGTISRLRGEVIDLGAAERGELVCVFKKGVDVHGIVRDAAGRPLPAIKIVETDTRHPSGPVDVLESDADGRFVLPDRDPHQLQLTLTGPGLATNAIVVTVAREMPEVAITMHPVTPLRVRTVDEAGRPVIGAKIQPNELLLDWTGTTDAEGRTVWPQAPVDLNAYRVLAEGYGSRKVKLAASASEQTIVLRRSVSPGLRLTIKASDEAGHPLDTFTVAALSQTPGGIYNDYNRATNLGEGHDGLATVLIPFEDNNRLDFRLKIESPGRQTYYSDSRAGAVGNGAFEDEELAVVLRSGESSRLLVALPDGQPAAGTSFAVSDISRQGSSVELMFLSPGKPGMQNQDAIRIEADATGSVLLPGSVPPDSPVFAVHAKGYLFSTLGELRRTTQVTLHPWGQLEGTLTLNGQPKADQRLELSPYPLTYADRVLFSHLRLQYFVNTDGKGHFVCDRVPTGDFVLYGTQVSEGAWPETHPTLVAVTAGQVTHVAYETRGRPVAGQIRISPGDAAIDWTKDVESSLLTRKKTQPLDERGEQPDPTDFVRDADLQRAFSEYLAAHQFAVPSTLETYQLLFDANGAFHADGVPAGTYELGVKLGRMTGTNTPWQRQELGSLQRTVVIPAPPVERAEEPWDLGGMELAVKADAVPKRAHVAFTAKTADGKAVTIADYRGKNVLILFRASWAPLSAQLMAEWKSVANSYGTNSRLVMLTVALDDQPGATPQTSAADALPGIATHLEGSAKASVTEALDVNDLPATFLVGPDGRLAAQDLAGSGLRNAVDAALSTP